ARIGPAQVTQAVHAELPKLSGGGMSQGFHVWLSGRRGRPCDLKVTPGVVWNGAPGAGTGRIYLLQHVKRGAYARDPSMHLTKPGHALFLIAIVSSLGGMACGIGIKRDLSAIPQGQVGFDDMCGLQDYFDGL